VNLRRVFSIQSQKVKANVHPTHGLCDSAVGGNCCLGSVWTREWAR